MSLAANQREYFNLTTEARRHGGKSPQVGADWCRSVLRNFCRQQSPEFLKICGAGECALRKDANDIGGLVKQKRLGGFMKLEIGAPGRFRTPELMVGNDSGLIHGYGAWTEHAAVAAVDASKNKRRNHELHQEQEDRKDRQKDAGDRVGVSVKKKFQQPAQ